jgi:hypothetical protein
MHRVASAVGEPCRDNPLPPHRRTPGRWRPPVLLSNDRAQRSQVLAARRGEGRPARSPSDGPPPLSDATRGRSSRGRPTFWRIARSIVGPVNTTTKYRKKRRRRSNDLRPPLWGRLTPVKPMQSINE